jgi:hypothetical protein
VLAIAPGQRVDFGSLGRTEFMRRSRDLEPLPIFHLSDRLRIVDQLSSPLRSEMSIAEETENLSDARYFKIKVCRDTTKAA